MATTLCERASVGRPLYDWARESHDSPYRHILSPPMNNSRFTIVDIHTRRAALAAGTLPGSRVESMGGLPANTSQPDTPLSLRERGDAILGATPQLQDEKGWPVGGAGITRSKSSTLLPTGGPASDTPLSIRARADKEEHETNSNDVPNQESQPEPLGCTETSPQPTWPLVWRGRQALSPAVPTPCLLTLWLTIELL